MRVMRVSRSTTPNISLKRREALRSLHAAVDLLPAKRRNSILGELGRVPFQYRIPFLKAMLGRLKQTSARRLYCLRCRNWQKGRVTNCPNTVCILFQYRPWKE